MRILHCYGEEVLGTMFAQVHLRRIIISRTTKPVYTYYTDVEVMLAEIKKETKIVECKHSKEKKRENYKTSFIQDTFFY